MISEENQIGSNCGQYVRKFINHENILLKNQGYGYVDAVTTIQERYPNETSKNYFSY